VGPGRSEHFNTRYSARPRLFWSFGYEKQRQSLHDSRRFGVLFQVHMWWYPGDCRSGGSGGTSGNGGGGGGGNGGGGGRRGEGWPWGGDARTASPRGLPKERLLEKEVLRLAEDFNVNWGGYETRLRVSEWLYTKVAALWEHHRVHHLGHPAAGGGGGGGGQMPLASMPPSPNRTWRSNAAADGKPHPAADGGQAAPVGSAVHPRAADTAAVGPFDEGEISEILKRVAATKIELTQLKIRYRRECAAGSGEQGVATSSAGCKTALVALTAEQTMAAKLVDALRRAYAANLPHENPPPPKYAAPSSEEVHPERAESRPHGSSRADGAGESVLPTPEQRARKLAGVEDGGGQFAWEEPQAWLLQCMEESRSRQQAGGVVTKAPDERYGNCAIRLGRQWPGGRVELNVVNQANVTLSLWQGSVLHFSEPYLVARSLVKPGETKHLISHEGEVWALKDGTDATVADWVVDVSKGVVQDFVLWGRGADAAAAKTRAGQGKQHERSHGDSGGSLGSLRPATMRSLSRKTSFEFFDGVFEQFNNFVGDLTGGAA
jgi:hypothetical protein